jgi:hypothetical protein
LRALEQRAIVPIMGTVLHDRSAEDPLVKARWFQSLPLAERMELLCELVDLALAAHPELGEKRNAQPPPGRVLLLARP